MSVSSAVGDKSMQEQLNSSNTAAYCTLMHLVSMYDACLHSFSK